MILSLSYDSTSPPRQPQFNFVLFQLASCTGLRETHRLLPRLGIIGFRNKLWVLNAISFPRNFKSSKIHPIPQLLMETKARRTICAKKLAGSWLRETQRCWKSDLLWGKMHIIGISGSRKQVETRHFRKKQPLKIAHSKWEGLHR